MHDLQVLEMRGVRLGHLDVGGLSNSLPAASDTMVTRDPDEFNVR